LETEGFDLGELLVGGGILPRAAAVTDVGVHDRAGREGGGRRKVGQGDLGFI
jgi:hypothetical protein